MERPVLVACAHGTRSPAGRRAVAALVETVRLARPQLDVREAFVDVQQPLVADVVREVCDGGRAVVVVPLLLSAGYHVGVDIARAVEGRAAVAAPALGPDDQVTQVLQERLRQVRLHSGDAVVLAAAGSSDPRAASDVETVAAALTAAHAGPVTIGYAATGLPDVAQAVAIARSARPRQRVVVASYLLAPGHFHALLCAAGADAVTATLVGDVPVDPRLVAVVLARFDAAARTLG